MHAYNAVELADCFKSFSSKACLPLLAVDLTAMRMQEQLPARTLDKVDAYGALAQGVMRAQASPAGQEARPARLHVGTASSCKP